jgi:hypothetical protein
MIFKILLPILVVALLALVWLGGGGEYLKNNYGNLFNRNSVSLTTPTPTTDNNTLITTTPTVTATVNQSNIPSDWQTYTNDQYGFTISYPAKYKALTDKENLYGWPNGVVLIYGGGQAYDISIEVWDTEAAYKQKYPGINLTVYQVGGKFLTIADQTASADNSEIIATFKLNK